MSQDVVELRQRIRDKIADDIANRIDCHQAKMARLKVGVDSLASLGAPAATKPLALLAHGDSWFDYPLSGNLPTFDSTDVIAHLSKMGRYNPIILNMAHHGDATTDELSLPKQERLISALLDKDNWHAETGKPDAILFSGGGNDIAGNQFCIFLDYAVAGSTGLDPVRFKAALDMVEVCYRDLFDLRDRYAAGVPIFGHAYDFAIPNGSHPPCVGPWLKPSLTYFGWTDSTQGQSIVRRALQDFQLMLANLAGNPSNNFILVSTQGTLLPADWANELHPYSDGFQKIADKFVQALAAKFPGRI